MNELLLKKTLAMMTKEYDEQHPDIVLVNSATFKRLKQQKAPRRIYNDSILETLKRNLIE